MNKPITLLLTLLLATGVAAENAPERRYRYRVYLADKQQNDYSVKHPERFLSPKALARRARFNLKVDAYDLPVSPKYLDGFRADGFRVVTFSKWNNTAVVETSDTLRALSLAKLPHVKSVRRVWSGTSAPAQPDTLDRHAAVTNKPDTAASYYGRSEEQIAMLNAQKLHEAGYRGEGMTIAVIDGGFYNADCIAGLKNCRVLGTRNFVRPGKSVYEEQAHGMMVLSCMAADTPHSLVGSAPAAAYYLLQSEDGDSENAIEEDYWCAAVEYADSIGADMVTSSLGYNTFDDPAASHRYDEQDGMTAPNSRAASLAASRGMLLLNSAGNSGDGTWKKIGFPADARDILTVGAVQPDRVNTVFSSVGNTTDGRVKPDVMAQGQAVALLDVNGEVGRANGTSFSTPLLCGAVACLWQAFPQKGPLDIMEAVRRSGDRADRPDNIYGYGIPDLWKAYESLKK